LPYRIHFSSQRSFRADCGYLKRRGVTSPISNQTNVLDWALDRILYGFQRLMKKWKSIPPCKLFFSQSPQINIVLFLESMIQQFELVNKGNSLEDGQLINRGRAKGRREHTSVRSATLPQIIGSFKISN